MTDAVQLGLFGDAESVGTQVKLDVEWSYSRRHMLEQCPRRYYYHYYGASARKAEAERQKERLRFLKGLSNRYLRTGELLHLAIRTYFKKRQAGETGSFDWLRSWVEDIYRKDRDYSRSGAYETTSPYQEHQPVVLMEYYHRLPDAEEMVEQSERRLLDSLESFLNSDQFAFLRLNGGRPSAYVEKHVRIEMGDFNATGKIDLAFRPNDEQILVCDWKTGSANTIRDSLQLLFYALWAVAERQYSPGNVVICKAFLGDGVLSTAKVSDQDLQRGRARIIQDFEKMKSLEEYGSNALAGAFTPCCQARVCELCRFREVCSEELE
jgi:hypothetical protein